MLYFGYPPVWPEDCYKGVTDVFPLLFFHRLPAGQLAAPPPLLGNSGQNNTNAKCKTEEKRESS